MLIMPPSNFSLMKWWSASTCVVGSWCSGLCAMLIVALLSQNSCIDSSHLIFNSPNSLLIHRDSQIPWAWLCIPRLHYFLQQQIVFCCVKFLNFPIIKYNPEVDFLSSIDSALSTSVNIFTSWSLYLANNSPFPGVPIKYLKILYTASRWRWQGSCMYCWLTKLTGRQCQVLCMKDSWAFPREACCIERRILMALCLVTGTKFSL